jgi:Lrp/AsnC family leucine-responsive transcriptional regulator
LSISFDATDHAIVERLRDNGRATNQQIAEALGLTAATVSARIRRMEDADQLRVVAVSDFAAHGYDLLLRVEVQVNGRAAFDVARDLAALPEVFAAHLVTGRYDIDMLVALRETADLERFLLDRIAAIDGIRSVNPSIIVDIVKYQFDVVPIEPET